MEYFSLTEAIELGLEVTEEGLLIGSVDNSCSPIVFFKDAKTYYLSPDDTIKAMDMGMGSQARSEYDCEV